nr:single-stranded DNA-binding protein [uncultured Butyrivibrio sp.]
MGKQNIAHLYARVNKLPQINRDKDTGEYHHGMCYVDTVRGLRAIEDDVKFVRHDHPLIIGFEKAVIDQMMEWKENDIVMIKGTVTSKPIPKTSYCPNCKDENGNPTKNQVLGQLIYITPIFTEVLRSYGDDKEAAIKDLVEHQEISNQIYELGTLIREPVLTTTKKGIQICQYPVALNRKFTIRTDDPSIRTDWPIVKSYGEKARKDKIFLKTGSEIFVDGFLQARTVHRKMKCACCGELYEWSDNSMELVAYDTEYLSGYKSREEVEAETQMKLEDVIQSLYESGYKDDLEEQMLSTDVSA